MISSISSDSLIIHWLSSFLYFGAYFRFPSQTPSQEGEKIKHWGRYGQIWQWTLGMGIIHPGVVGTVSSAPKPRRTYEKARFHYSILWYFVFLTTHCIHGLCQETAIRFFRRAYRSGCHYAKWIIRQPIGFNANTHPNLIPDQHN